MGFFVHGRAFPLVIEAGASYLERRGIAADVADQYGVRYCPDLSGLWTLTDKKKIKVAGLSSLYAFQKAGLPIPLKMVLSSGMDLPEYMGG